MEGEFEKFMNLRKERAGKKYVMPDGTNQSMYRNSALDVMEEIGDAAAIAMLWLDKLEKEPKNLSTYTAVIYVVETIKDLKALWEQVLYAYNIAPESTVKDTMEGITRLVNINKDGSVE